MGELLQLPMRKLMVSIDTARAVLGKSEDQVIEMIEDARIRFAWNIASNTSRKRCVRVFVPSLADAVNKTDHQPAEVEDAIKFILPGSAPTVRASRLAQAFNVGGTHLAALMKQRCLTKVRPGRSRTESAHVDRESIVRFLTLRRIA
jgi:hypothetical protein